MVGHAFNTSRCISMFEASLDYTASSGSGLHSEALSKSSTSQQDSLHTFPQWEPTDDRVTRRGTGE